jgi:ABC transport system ATP-binding/permease protein
VLQEVAGDNDHVMLESGPIHVRSFLRMMLFDDGFADTPVGALSGGERNRVQLAKLLRIGGNTLVLDEPTNDLDLMTLGVLEESLIDFPGCALVVSHDRWFLDRIATAILAFEPDVEPGRVIFHEGNYSAYLERRRAEVRASAAAAAPSATSARTRAPVAKKLSFKERQELETMEATIATAETRIKELEETLADPAVYSKRAAEVPTLVAALETARAEVERLFARWQELDALPK